MPPSVVPKHIQISARSRGLNAAPTDAAKKVQRLQEERLSGLGSKQSIGWPHPGVEIVKLSSNEE